MFGPWPGEDDDLIRLTLHKPDLLPPDASVQVKFGTRHTANGTVDVLPGSNPVRVFARSSDASDDAAYQIYLDGFTVDGQTVNPSLDAFVMDFAHPQGPLAGLSNGDVDLWLEGVSSMADLTVSYVLQSNSAGIMAQDVVDLRIDNRVDIDIDSDNSTEGNPEQTPEEDFAEDDPQRPGKVAVLNDSDLDNNGVPEFAQGYTGAVSSDSYLGRFIPVVIKVPAELQSNLSSSMLRITYGGSDPASVTVLGDGPNKGYVPAGGYFRLWSLDGDQPRTAVSLLSLSSELPNPPTLGYYVAPGEYTGVDLLNLKFISEGGMLYTTLYLEAVRKNTAGPGSTLSAEALDAAQHIKVELYPNAAIDSAFSDDRIKVSAVADVAPDAGSSFDVRNLDGAVTYASTDLSSDAMGLPWGQTRVWTNEPESALPRGPDFNGNGNGVNVAQWPRIIEGTSTLIVLIGGQTLYFDRYVLNSQPGLHERFGGQEQLYYEMDQCESPHPVGYILLEPDGTRYYFDLHHPYHPGASPLPEFQRGLFKRMLGPGGQELTVDRHTADGRIERVHQWVAQGEYVFYDYVYEDNDGKSGPLKQVSLFNRHGLVQEAKYTYYTNDGQVNGTYCGSAGDLETVQIMGRTGQLLETKYYRYDQAETQPRSRLRLALEGKNFARMQAAGFDPLFAPDSVLGFFADYQFGYDGHDNATAQSIQGTGASLETEPDPEILGSEIVVPTAIGTYTYTYGGSDATGSNAFSASSVVTPPGDVAATTVYMNHGGQVMGTATTVGSSTQYTYTGYDRQGRVVVQAMPSAVSGFGATVDLVGCTDATNYRFNSISNDEGLLQITYYNFLGLVASQAVRRGDNTSDVLQRELTYMGRYWDDHWIFKVESDKSYPTAGGAAATTGYAYTFAPTSQFQPVRIDVNPPIVPETQNGSGYTEPTISLYDLFGRVTQVGRLHGLQWPNQPLNLLDEHIDDYTTWTSYQYDDETGSLTQTIVDDPINSNSSGLRLKTTIKNDALGRPIRIINPAQQDQTNQPATVIRYRDNAQQRTVVTIPLAGPTAVTRYVMGTGETQTYTVAAGGDAMQSLSVSLTDLGGRVVEEKRYYDLKGLGQAEFIGSRNVTKGDFYTTEYGYDQAGRPDRVKNAVKTVTRTAYDGLGRPTATWVGTYDGDWYGSGSPGTNMTKVSENQYDNGGVGDDNLTKVTLHPDGTASDDRVTVNLYDWRDRLTSSKSGVQTSENEQTNRPLTVYTYNNLSEQTSAAVYDGDTVTMTDNDKDGLPDSLPGAARRALSDTFYDGRGRVYSTVEHAIGQTDGQDGGSLTTGYWYDQRDNPVKTSNPGGLVSKTVYDKADRAVAQSTTDGGSDVATGSGGTWASAMDLSGDAIIEQVATEYDKNGNPIFLTSSQLGDSSSRVSHTANWYDAADRLIATADAGTMSYSRTDQPPAWAASTATATSSDGTYLLDTSRTETANELVGRSIKVNGKTRTISAYDPATHTITFNTALTSAVTQNMQYTLSPAPLLVSYVYDNAGRKMAEIDPMGIVTEWRHDDAGRVTWQYENVAPGEQSADANRTTQYSYDGLDRQTKVTAYRINSLGLRQDDKNEETCYEYEARKGDSFINSNDLLSKVKYPGWTRDAKTSAAYSDSITYNALGEIRSKVDRLGIGHIYTYDSAGRVTNDSVGQGGLPVGVDPAVHELKTEYDVLGRPTKFTSVGLGTTDIKNEVKREYNSFGQITKEWQDHDSDVAQGATPTVQYDYELANNHSRLIRMTYPDGVTTIVYDYGVAAGLNDRISRIQSIREPASGNSTSSGTTTTLIDTNRPEPAGQLLGGTITVAGQTRRITDYNEWTHTITFAPALGSATTSSMAYTLTLGLETYGYLGLGGVAGVGRGSSGQADLALTPDEFGRAQTLTWTSSPSESYTYDRNGNLLTRVYEDHGELNETFGYDNLNRVISFQRGTANASTYVLDSQGNRTQTGRTYQKDNRIQQTGFDYDKNGNLTGSAASGDQRRTRSVTYDAWGREMYVGAAAIHSRRFAKYDALGRQVSFREEAAFDGSGVPELRDSRDVYYSADGQVIQENDSVTGLAACRYVWSPVTGQLVLRDRDRNGSAADGLEERLWVLWDKDGSTKALADNSGRGEGAVHI